MNIENIKNGYDTVARKYAKSLFDEKVELDYVFLKTDSIVDALKGSGFKIIEALTRYPYEGYEYASKRGYIICKKTRV